MHRGKLPMFRSECAEFEKRSVATTKADAIHQELPTYSILNLTSGHVEGAVLKAIVTAGDAFPYEYDFQ